MRRPLVLLLLLTILAPAITTHPAAAETTKRWSDPVTWNGQPPAEGETVTIPKNTTVLLDVSPPPLAGLQIEGTLRFANQADADLALVTDWIVVTGRLEIGTEAAPFTGHATITLTDTTPDEDVFGMGDKVLGVMNGALELHGDPRGPSWTRLDSTAHAGDDRLQLETNVDWRPGDHLVLASTDFDPYQAEEVVIATVAGDVVTLESPLASTHWGEIQTFGAATLNERAEAGLLSHNIVIQGDDASEDGGYGGHLMVMGGTAHIANVEFTRMGQAGHLARYPVHFHLLGDRPDAYVRDSAIHHVYNRCLTVHGTNDVTVANNVAYDARGHCFFLEDGLETGNQFIGNLGVLTRTPEPDNLLLPSDELPATFWITNPANTLRGNVAAGSDAFGFWYALPEHPHGLSQSATNDETVWPRRTPLTEFRNNVAHSNGFRGLNVDDGPTPDGVTEVTFYDPHENPVPPVADQEDSATVVADFTGFTAYKNRERGVWLRGANERLTDAVLADNLIGATFASVDTFVEDSLFVGESANTGTPAEGETTGLGGRALPQSWDASFPIRGYEFYDGAVGARNVAFAAYHSNDLRPASGIGVLRRDEFALDPRNAAEGITWLDDSNRVYLDSPTSHSDGEKTAIFRDRDGSITGHPGAVITADQPFLHDAGCTAQPAWNAAVCFGQYGALSFESIAPGPVLVGPVILRRDDGVSLWLNGTPSENGTPSTYFQASLTPNAAYTTQFVAVPWRLRLAFSSEQSGDWVRLTIPYPAGDPHIYPGYDPSEESALPRADSLDALSTTDSAWTYDGETLVIQVVIPEGQDTVVLDICRHEGCA